MKTASVGKIGGFPILYQILATLCIIALIPLGGLWYIGIYKAKQDWTNIIFKNLVEATETLSSSVDEWTDMNLSALEQNALTPAIRSMDTEQQHPILRSITDAYDWVYLAFTVLPNGQNIGRSDTKPLKYYGDRNYFKQVMSGKTQGQQVLLGKTSGKPALVLAKPIPGSAKKPLGVIAIAMSLKDLSKTVTNTKIGSTGFAILLDANNRLIAHGKGLIAAELQDFSHHPALRKLNSPNQDSFIFEENSHKIVSLAKTTSYGWTLIVQQDYAEAYQAANRARLNAVFLLTATCLAVLIISYILANRLSSPLRNLTRIADEISRGKLSIKIPETTRSDEIGALALAIERMVVSLQIAFERLRKR